MTNKTWEKVYVGVRCPSSYRATAYEEYLNGSPMCSISWSSSGPIINSVSSVMMRGLSWMDDIGHFCGDGAWRSINVVG